METFAGILSVLLALRTVARLLSGDLPTLDGALLIFFLLYLSII